METEIIVVRHGETAWNRKLKFQGQSDISLNEIGFSQAGQVSSYLADEKLDGVYASDLKRAYNTAEVIADPHDLEVKQLKGLREMNFGEWEGLTYKEIEKGYPGIIDKWYHDPTAVSPPEGERLIDFQQRIIKAFYQILTENSGGRVLVVSHGGSIRAWLAHLLEMPLKKYWRLEVNNTGTSIVKFYNENPVLKLLNSTAHLDL